MRELLCLVAIFMNVSLLAYANDQTVVKEPGALAVARSSMQAMGGAALAAYRDSLASGTVTIHSDTGTRTFHEVIRSKGLHMLRIDRDSEKIHETYISDGTWAIFKRAKRDCSSTDLQNLHAQRVDYIPGLSILSEHGTKNMNAQYGGTELVNGQLTDVIALSFVVKHPPEFNWRNVPGFDGLKLTQRVFYVDHSTHLITKVQFAHFFGNHVEEGTKTEVYFSNYKLIDGIAVPFSTRTFMDGKLISKRDLLSIVFNTGLSDSDFDASCSRNSDEN